MSAEQRSAANGAAVPAPKPPDPPGTCHLVGCPGKGVHPPHGIGVPSNETWRELSQPTPVAPKVLVERRMAARLIGLAMRVERGALPSAELRTEARILREYLQDLL